MYLFSIFNVSLQDLIIFRVEVLEPHLLFGKMHSESSRDLRQPSLLESDMWQNFRIRVMTKQVMIILQIAKSCQGPELQAVIVLCSLYISGHCDYASTHPHNFCAWLGLSDKGLNKPQNISSIFKRPTLVRKERAFSFEQKQLYHLFSISFNH